MHEWPTLLDTTQKQHDALLRVVQEQQRQTVNHQHCPICTVSLPNRSHNAAPGQAARHCSMASSERELARGAALEDAGAAYHSGMVVYPSMKVALRSLAHQLCLQRVMPAVARKDAKAAPVHCNRALQRQDNDVCRRSKNDSRPECPNQMSTAACNSGSLQQGVRRRGPPASLKITRGIRLRVTNCL